jgi:hypothetical protein
MRRESGINEREHEIDHDPVLFEAEPTEETGDETTAIRALIDLNSIQTILENDWVNATVCRGDYSRSGDGESHSQNRFLPDGPVSPAAPLNELKAIQPKTAWVDQKVDGRQVVTLYWGYTSYIISLDLRKAIYSFGKLPRGLTPRLSRGLPFYA